MAPDPPPDPFAPPPPLELDQETFGKALDVALAKNEELEKARQLGTKDAIQAVREPRKATKPPFRFADTKAKRRRASATRSAQRRRR